MQSRFITEPEATGPVSDMIILKNWRRPADNSHEAYRECLDEKPVLSPTDQPLTPFDLQNGAIYRRWRDGVPRNVRSLEEVVWETDADLRVISWRNKETPDESPAANTPGCTVFELLARDPANERAIETHRKDLLSRRPFRGFVHRAIRPGGI